MNSIVRIFNDLKLELNMFGYLPISSRWKNEDSYIGLSRIFFIESGEGYLRLDGKTIPLKPGYMYLLPSRIHVAYGCTQLKKIWFQFRLLSATVKGDLLSVLNEVYVLPYKQEVFDALLDCIYSPELYAMLQLKNLLMDTICCFAREFQFPPMLLKKPSAQLQAAEAYIQANATASMTIKHASQHLFMSESALRRLFRTEKNTSVGKYIDQCTIRRAKVLLENPELSMGQISQMLGFCEQFYFSRCFKHNTGMTPSAYRKKLLSN